MENGRILRLEKRVDPTTLALETVLDARGLHVWPGLLDANTHVGLTEENPQCVDPADAAFAQAAAAGITVVEVCPAGSTPAPRRCTLWQTGSHPKQLDKPGALLLPMEGETESQLRNDLMQARAQGLPGKAASRHGSGTGAGTQTVQAYGGAVTLEHRAPTAALAEEIAHSGMPVVVGVGPQAGRGKCL